MGKEIGLYIHIPFCKAKCNYCDFNSYPGREVEMAPYFKALGSEVCYWSDKLWDAQVKTVFIGGGTPSLAEPGLISGLLSSLRKNLDIKPDAEISIETNPGTLSREKLEAYRACGINRLSMGLQTWQDRLMKELGRIHSRAEFLENLEAARDVGFENINADLIFGLPGQTAADWEETLRNVAALGIPHISCYDLIIEEGTAFGDRFEKGLLKPMEDELDREMYRNAVQKLTGQGFRHYEISNFALPGYECRHNLIYWKAEEYLGIGAGAHSYLFGKRFNNSSGIDEYIEKISRLSKNAEADNSSTGYARSDSESCPDTFLAGAEIPEQVYDNITSIDKAESMSEFIILGLRLVEGVSLAEFRERYGEELTALYGRQISELSGKGLLRLDDGMLKLTEAGLDLANKVFVEFV